MSRDPLTPTPADTPRFEVDGEGIGWLTFDDPDRPLNVLTEAVMLRLDAAVAEAHEAAARGDVRVVVVRSGKPDSFIAGADVEAIADLEDPSLAERKVRQGQQVFSALAALPIPTLAAIHGICVGGGLELTLACRSRVASNSGRTRLGLPEVMLGILPAWGGTSRLPRWIGLRAALDLLLTGKQVDASKALRIGLVDAVLPTDLFDEEVARHARRLARRGIVPPRTRRGLAGSLLEGHALGRRIILRAARRRVLAQTGGHYPAPLRILDVLRSTLGRDVERGLAAEARAAGELIVSDVCKNLIHVFRLREGARKRVPDDAGTGARITRIGILGAGVMGGGIAQLAAYRGIDAYMKDIRHEAVTGGLRHARELFDKAVARRKTTAREARVGMERITGGVDYAGLSGAELVIEAVVERLEVKRQVLAEVEAEVRPDCLLATNTSSLSVAAMAGALERPERFLGMHFFNPVHRMPLVEVVRGPESSDEAVAAVYRFALRLDKVPVVVRDGPGFVVNRVLGPYLNEGGFLLADGATIAEIDRVATRFGLPMGPLRLIDEVGIDVAAHAGAVLHEALGERLAPSPALVAIGASERLGRKGGKGFYTYQDGKAVGPDPSVYDLLDLPTPSRSRPRGPDDDEVRRRLVLTMINEAARVLEEGIARSAADVDLAMIMGTGFPPFRGGLLRCADALHARSAVDLLRALERRYGERFSPAPVLLMLAEEDRGFYDAFPQPA